ncbi:MAG TPA: hypothetical protein VGK03_11055 [Geothrix sp.]|jgi:hypothetical protein
MKKLNLFRNIASDEDPEELIRFEHTVNRLIKKYGFEKVEEHYAQATINECETRFQQKLKIMKGNYKLSRNGFLGDHVSLWDGPDGVVYRCDEYPMSWNELLERIYKYQELGLDGYVSGQSVHLPGMTFGIVGFKKGAYTTKPGI